jgi:hypothetical protein
MLRLLAQKQLTLLYRVVLTTAATNVVRSVLPWASWTIFFGAGVERKEALIQNGRSSAVGRGYANRSPENETLGHSRPPTTPVWDLAQLREH